VPAESVKSAGLPRIAAEQVTCRQMEQRALFEALTDDRPVSWYGSSPAWQVALEASARRMYGTALRLRLWPNALEYRIALDVHGPNDLTEVVVMFYGRPLYDAFGLAPKDYPRVWAERGMASKHRMPDDGALCLYYPLDPAWRRWTADKGLLDLLDLIVDHLGYEAYWRATGGHDGGVWLGDEAEHGFTQEAAA
jgi:hypothetical protein